jgi:DNA-binding NarL/FixJ family response regulator
MDSVKERENRSLINALRKPELRAMVGLLLSEGFPGSNIVEPGDLLSLTPGSADRFAEIIFLDYETTTRNNFESLRALRDKGINAAFITIADYVEDVVFVRGIREGVRGFVYEGSLYHDLKPAIEAVGNGGIFISRFT